MRDAAAACRRARACGEGRDGLLRLSMADRDLRAAIGWLGLAQCIAWGVLYYGFAFWLVPLQQSLGAPMPAVAGAYSLALGIAALLAPRIGRAFDRGQGRALLRLGSVAAALGLGGLLAARSLPGLWLAGAGIGVAMALLLYESAFALVQQAVPAPAPRLRALAAVTVMGGLASTVFLPLLGGLAANFGLPASLAAGLAMMLAVAGLVEWRIAPVLLRRAPSAAPADAGGVPAPDPRLRPILWVFTTSTVAGITLTTLLVPHLVAAGVGLGTAAGVLAALGLAQLPGRLWLLRGGRLPGARVLATWPLPMQAMGLLLVAAVREPWAAAAGVGLFGLGAGLHTLARPWLVQARFGAQAGQRNGEVARAQGVGRALGPLLAVLAAGVAGSPAVLGLAAIALLAMLPVAEKLSRAEA